MKVNLQGKIIFITGGSSGLGYEMAKTLLKHGATVIIGARNLDSSKVFIKIYHQA